MPGLSPNQPTKFEPDNLDQRAPPTGSTVATPTHRDQIKAILEPFRWIQLIILENIITHPCVSHCTWDHTVSPPVLTLHVVYNGTELQDARGCEAFAQEIPSDLRTAAMKIDMCDITTSAFLFWIQEALQPIGAIVDLLLMCPKPLAYLRYSCDSIPEDLLHSAFCITSLGRDQYIADFTIEQFGYQATAWFAEKSEYLEHCTTGYWRIMSEDDLAVPDHLTSSSSTMTEFKRYSVAICEDMIWPLYQKLPVHSRRAWIETHAQQAIDRVQAKMYSSRSRRG